MAVYREGYKMLEALQKASKRIFPDAADFGVPVKKDDKHWMMAKQLVQWHGKIGSKVVKYRTGTTSTNIVTMMDEWAVSDNRKSHTEALEYYQVQYVTCKHEGYDGYITITKLDEQPKW